MDAYIQQNALLVYALVMIAAALLHWGQKVRKGEATANFIAYWFTETPGYSAGTFGALGAAWWLVYTTHGLDNMAAHMVVESAFATGWMINSAVTQGFVAEMAASDAKKQPAGGFVRLSLLPWLLVLSAGVMLLSGCPATMPTAAVPKTIPEQIEAANLLVDKLSDGIVELTCTQFVKAQCVEPGKPLMPDDAISLHASVQRAHAGLMLTSMIPIDGLGQCLGQQRTQLQCLSAATALLTEVDRKLIAQNAKKGVQ